MVLYIGPKIGYRWDSNPGLVISASFMVHCTKQFIDVLSIKEASARKTDLRWRSGVRVSKRRCLSDPSSNPAGSSFCFLSKLIS